MILAYRVLERRIKALRRAILHVFFVLNLNRHIHGDFINLFIVIKKVNIGFPGNTRPSKD